MAFAFQIKLKILNIYVEKKEKKKQTNETDIYRNFLKN